jgi:hypothetical protein
MLLVSVGYVAISSADINCLRNFLWIFFGCAFNVGPVCPRQHEECTESRTTLLARNGLFLSSEIVSNYSHLRLIGYDDMLSSAESIE